MVTRVLSDTQMKRFADYLFDREDWSSKAARILRAILESRSPRLSEIAEAMSGNPAAHYKTIQRFLAEVDPKRALWRLYHEEAPFVLVDVTEVPRSQARKTEYVGRLQDGKTRGFWLLVLATPYRGRAIPFSLVTYSSRTIRQSGRSRNLEHRRALGEVQMRVGDKPVVMDREFSYGGLLEALQEAGLHFVVRLNAGRHPTFTGEDGEKVTLTIAPGERKVYRGLAYLGKVRVNVAGEWPKGLREPLWVMTDGEPEEGLEIYRQRMKVEECFKDLKDLLSLGKVMNKKQENMEKMVAMVLIAYALGLLVGEELRDLVYGPVFRDGGSAGPGDPPPEGRDDEAVLPAGPTARPEDRPRGGLQPRPGEKTGGKRWGLYSGLFVLLKQKIRVSAQVFRQLIDRVLEFFRCLVFGGVRTHF